MDEIEVELGANCLFGYGKENPRILVIRDNFTASDCLLAMVLNRLDWLGHGDFMAKENRPLLSIWWENVNEKESFRKSTWLPNMSIQMIKSILVRNKSSVIIGLAVAFALAYAYKQIQLRPVNELHNVHLIAKCSTCKYTHYITKLFAYAK